VNLKIGEEVTINFLGNAYAFEVLPLSPIKALEFIPKGLDELQKELESIDPENNRNEYINTANKIQSIADNANKEKLKAMCFGEDAKSFIDAVEKAGHLSFVIEKIEDIFKKNSPTQ